MAEVDDPVQTDLDQDNPKPAKPARRNGMVWAVLGGILAAGTGFGLAQMVPGGWPIASTAQMEIQIAAVTQETAALQAELVRVAALAGQPAADTALADRVTALERAETVPVAPDLSVIIARIDALESRLQTIIALPTEGGGVSPAAMAALQSDIAALKAAPVSGAGMAEIDAKIAAFQSQADAIRADLADMVRNSTTSAAIGRIRAALDSGQPYAAALGDLGDAQVPEILAANAGTGLPSLVDLQQSFPEAARLALEAALVADAGQSWADRVTAFLRNQTGARSLTPREGDDPDAVLSRVEAALIAGDLDTALILLKSLPAESLAAMASWQAQAEKRQLATLALSGLANALAE